MMGWAQNDAEGSFWTTSVAEASARLSELIERYRPQVVVTYDANGFYGHPDHIQAHRIAVTATAETAIPDKVYFPAIPRSGVALFRETIRSAGLEMPGEVDDDDWDLAVADEMISAIVDCTGYVDKQYDALKAHASQGDNAFFLRLGPELFSRLMALEMFVRAFDRTGAPTPEADLFAGLRP